MNTKLQMVVRMVLVAASFLAIGLTSTSANAGTLYVIGAPSGLQPDELVALTKAAIRLALAAEPGDRIRVFDGFGQIPIADITVKKARTDRALLRAIAPAIARIPAYYKTAAEGPEPSYRLHIPNLLDTVASITEPGFDEVRILLFGSMGFGDGKDSRFDFEAGRYPSDGHILATSELSVFGVADKQKLEHTRIDVFNMMPIEDNRDRYYIQRFWTIFAAERGALLTSWKTNASMVVEMATKSLDAPVEKFEIDRHDLRREIRRVDGPRLLPNIWTIVVCIDATASMEDAFDEIRREIPGLASRLYDSGAEIRLAIIPFRSKTLVAFPLTKIRSVGSDGGQSIALVNLYLDGVGTSSASANPGDAILAGLSMLTNDRGPEGFTSLLLIGDTSPETPDSQEMHSRVISELCAWRDAEKHRSFHGVFLGSSTETDVQYFQDLAGGDNVAPSFKVIADRIVEQAANVTRGIRPE